MSIKKTKKGKIWSQNTVRVVLENELYIEEQIMHKTVSGDITRRERKKVCDLKLSLVAIFFIFDMISFLIDRYVVFTFVNDNLFRIEDDDIIDLNIVLGLISIGYIYLGCLAQEKE